MWTAAETHLRRGEQEAVRPPATRAFRRDLAGVLVSADRLDEAEAIVAGLHEESESVSDDEEPAELLRLDGRLHHARGNLAAARDALRSARDTFRRIGWQTTAASVALDLGLVEADDGDLTAAAAQLAEAAPLSARPSDRRRHQRLVATITQGGGA
jgi:ATP/maltotriose-dependent transcriptional regulator MalT